MAKERSRTAKFVWKAELEFRGTADEYAQFAELCDQYDLQVRIPEWADIIDNHTAGCNPVVIDHLLPRDWLQGVIKGAERYRLRFVKDIYGGIRTPHLHLGDEVAMLSRAQFKEVARELAHRFIDTRIDSTDDYISVMRAVGNLHPSRMPGRVG